MASLLPFRRAFEIQIEIEPSVSADVASDVKRSVRAALDHLAGGWRTVIRRSPYDRYRWRMELQSGSGRHVWLFLAAEHDLPRMAHDVIEAYVRRSATHYYVRHIRRTAPAGHASGVRA